MGTRVTLKDIAKEAGVHFTTVSLALRNDPRLPPETRERLRTLADKMGYRPDAAMKALCAYRQMNRPHPIQSGLAYLTDIPDTNPLGRLVFTESRKVASRLGYNLSAFNLSDPGGSLEHFMRVWTNTGIRGVIVGPFDKPSKLAKGKWERWVSVAFGYSVESPDFNRVVLDHFHNMLMHLGILRQRGYKRIGLLLYGTHETQVPGLLMGAYLLEQARTGARRIAARIREELNTPRKMKAWILKERLDALIAPIEEYRILRRTGLRIPDDIGFSLLSWKAYDPLNPGECSGVNANPEHVAMDTVSFLVSQLHEHAFGLSERPKCLLVPGTFQDGSTIRPPA